MKKTKILLGALSLTALAPMIPTALTSCGGNAKTDDSFTPEVKCDANVESYNASKTELNRAFSVTMVCKSGYEVDSTTTTVKVGDKTLTLDADYIVYYDTIIVSSKAVTSKTVKINVVTKQSTPTETFVVTLYAGDGTFTDSKKTLTISNVKKNTKLSEIEGYAKPTMEDLTFSHWLSDEGKIVDESTLIKSNMVLSAQFKEVAHPTTHKLETDNWATIVNMCADMSTFVKAYIKQSFTGTEQEAKTLILEEIQKNALATTEDDKTLYKTLKLSLGIDWSTEVKVRLIDVDKDKAADSKITKPMFTWEFTSSIDVSAYNHVGNSHWCEFTEGEESASCLLRENCKQVLINKLPTNLAQAIIPVTKTTAYWDSGKKPDITSTETLFPLNYAENGIHPDHPQYFYKDADKTYTFYACLDGKLSGPNRKSYMGYDGTKEYSEGYAPEIFYPCWTRSPFDTTRIYIYNPDNNRLQVVYSNGGFGIAPAFCL